MYVALQNHVPLTCCILIAVGDDQAHVHLDNFLHVCTTLYIWHVEKPVDGGSGTVVVLLVLSAALEDLSSSVR